MKTLQATSKYPRAERYELVSQIRRAAISIPSNIAEGYRRRSRREYVHFLSISYGSSGELAYQLHLSFSLHYLSREEYNTLNNLVDEVSRMLRKMMESLSGMERAMTL